jgi:UDP-GlcNAc:undecaprenyl-phosphate GlcNAc-1-phosphate transferase
LGLTPFIGPFIVGIINALNLIDGLDGLAAGVAGIAALFLLGAQMLNGHVPNLLSGVVFLGALIGFLVFNRHPASIFMGDCGSLFLGYFLAVFALPLYVDSTNYYLILVPICALGLPIFDTLSAMTRRILARRSPFSADKEHIHHRIHSINRTKSGPYRRTVYSLYIICVAFGTFALVISVGQAEIIGGSVVLLLVFIALLLYRYDYLTILVRFRRWLVPHAPSLLGDNEEQEPEPDEDTDQTVGAGLPHDSISDNS